MSQISKETECNNIEVINGSAVHRLADARASASVSGQGFHHCWQFTKMKLNFKVGKMLKLLAISYDIVVRRNAASTILKNFEHTEKLK